MQVIRYEHRSLYKIYFEPSIKYEKQLRLRLTQQLLLLGARIRSGKNVAVAVAYVRCHPLVHILHPSLCNRREVNGSYFFTICLRRIVVDRARGSLWLTSSISSAVLAYFNKVCVKIETAFQNRFI